MDDTIRIERLAALLGSNHPLRVERRDLAFGSGRTEECWYVVGAREGSGVYGSGWATREEAEAHLIGRTDPQAAAAYLLEHAGYDCLAGSNIPATLTRDAYEQRCAAAGVRTLADGSHYFGVYSFPEYTADEIVCMKLAMRRMDTWNIEQRPAREAAAAAARVRLDAERPARPCAACGVMDRFLLSSSTRGAVCADCYDRVESEAG